MPQDTKKTFQNQKTEYAKINTSFKPVLVWRVGVEAGLYSELGSMFEAMLYAYMNRIRFVLYADNANFSNKNGWNEFFEPFCDETHVIWHKWLNRRRAPRRYKKIFELMQKMFKKSCGIDYLTQDLFRDVISKHFKDMPIKWELFGMDGTVYPEIAKIFPYAMRYTEETECEIETLCASLHLPAHYTSIQIRGGDKVQEFGRVYDAEDCLKRIRARGLDIEHLFVFTDDYRNIVYLKQHMPDTKIYTLTNPEEQGYINAEFQHAPWEYKRKNLIKLFAMVELCCKSDLHLGCEQACVNTIIKLRKGSDTYIPLTEVD